MPKMTHWNSADLIDVTPEKAAVYAAQGWVTVGKAPSKVQPGVTAMTTEVAAAAPEPAPEPTPEPAKKAPAKKATKKAAKKS